MKEKDWAEGLFEKKHVAKLNAKVKETRKPKLFETKKFQDAKPELRRRMMAAAHQRKVRLLQNIWNPYNE